MRGGGGGGVEVWRGGGGGGVERVEGAESLTVTRLIPKYISITNGHMTKSLQQV